MDKKEIEDSVIRILRRCGFLVTQQNEVIEASIDLPRKVEDFKIMIKTIDCKQENKVRDAIFRWADKENQMSVDKVILIVKGIEVLGEDRYLADQRDIIIIEESNILEYLEMYKKDEKEAEKKIMAELGLGSYLDRSIDYTRVEPS